MQEDIPEAQAKLGALPAGPLVKFCHGLLLCSLAARRLTLLVCPEERRFLPGRGERALEGFQWILQGNSLRLGASFVYPAQVDVDLRWVWFGELERSSALVELGA